MLKLSFKRSLVVHNLLSVYKVAGLLDLFKHVPHIVVPLIQCLIRLLLCCSSCALLENNYALHAVDLSCNASLLYNHVTQLLLRTLDSHTSKLCQALELYPRVVELNHSNVVLDQLSDELREVENCMLSILHSEWLVPNNIMLNFLLYEGHELGGKEATKEL